jgi:hypothetical protein
MASSTARDDALLAYLLLMATRSISMPFTSLEAACQQFNVDIAIIHAIQETRYLGGRDHHVPKAGNMHLAWEYAEDPADHHRFINMLCVSPHVFNTIVALIANHPTFHNNSNNNQAPVEVQLAVFLYRMGRYGNGASVQDIARIAGCSEGSVENFTARCLTAVESLHDLFVRKPTAEEKEKEKMWVEGQMGFGGLWREGWLMYDGTIVVLDKRPGLNGDAYYTRKANYGLNLQVSNMFVLILTLSHCN